MTIGTRLSWDGGIDIATDSIGGSFDPVVVAPPTPRAVQLIVAQVIDSVTSDGTNFTPAIRTVSHQRTRYRILVGGKDVTYFRGVQTPLPTYGLEEPLLYGSGLVTFPQIHAAYERPGHGALTWLKKFARVRIQRLDVDGNVIATDYRGFVADFQHDGRDLSCTLGGQATGTAALRDRPVPIFPVAQDIGDLVMTTIDDLRLPTANQPTTGIKIVNTGGGSQLDFLTEILAKSTTLDGQQWTVAPNSSGAYRMFKKDTTTIDCTVYIDGFRVVESLKRDFTEEPNRVWAQGIGPDGRRIRFAKFPGLTSGTAPSFPGTLSPGDSGDNVTALKWRLYTVGYLDDEPDGLSWTTGSDDPITDAVKDLQDDADLSQTGVVDSATWKALFNPDVTGYALRRSAQRPAAQKSYTRTFNYDATGQIIGANPNYDRTKPIVDVSIDVGPGFTRRQIQRWAKHEMADDNTSNWVGTITIATGAVIDGEHNPGDPLDASGINDVRSIKPGHNVWVPNWDGGTLFHISGVNISADSCELTVDTRARDAMKVWEVISRNRESRKSPARQWIAQNRRSGMRDDSTAFYDGSVFGKVPRTFLPADTWTVIATPGGRSGTLNLVDIQTVDAKALFGLSIWGKQVTTSWLNRHLGDPFGKPYEKRVQHNTKAWQDNKWLVDIWGQKDQPCGYWPDVLDPNAFNVVSQTGASVDAATDTFTLSHHGYNNGDVVYFSSGSVPAGLTADNDYYVIAATTSTFKVSASRGGSAMDITADSSGIVVSIHVASVPDVTGQYRFKAGTPYFCVGSPVLWVAIRPDRNCYLQGGRILDLLLDDSAG